MGSTRDPGKVVVSVLQVCSLALLGVSLVLSAVIGVGGAASDGMVDTRNWLGAIGGIMLLVWGRALYGLGKSRR